MCIFSYCCLATASIMAEAVFEKDWSDKMSSIIQQKCALSESCHGCVKWEGAVFQPGGYGKIAVQMKDKRRKYYRVHRLVYMIQNNMAAIPVQDDCGHRLEISHICHQKLCVKPEHLVLETHEVNMERLHCKVQRLCTKSHQPHCLLVSFINQQSEFIHSNFIFVPF